MDIREGQREAIISMLMRLIMATGSWCTLRTTVGVPSVAIPSTMVLSRTVLVTTNCFLLLDAVTVSEGNNKPADLFGIVACQTLASGFVGIKLFRCATFLEKRFVASQILVRPNEP